MKIRTVILASAASAFVLTQAGIVRAEKTFLDGNASFGLRKPGKGENSNPDPQARVKQTTGAKPKATSIVPNVEAHTTSKTGKSNK